MNESPQSAAAQGAAPPLELAAELPDGWRSAERDDWTEPDAARRRRSLVLRIAVVFLVVAGLTGVLIWVAAGHYARGVEALNDHSYSLAMSELAAAQILVFPYRDARALEDQAQRALQAETAARAAQQGLVSGVGAQLAKAGARLQKGDAAGVLAALSAIKTGDLRTTLLASDNAAESAGGITEDLEVAATTALRQAEWGRAGRYAAAMLVLEPSSERALALAERASVGERLRAKLADARDAAQRGKWRAALRLALAIVAVRKDFPGAAALVADARAALAPKPRPKPRPTPTQAPPAPAPGPVGPTTPPAPPAPPAPPEPPPP